MEGSRVNPLDVSIQLTNEDLKKLLKGQAIRVSARTTLGLDLGTAQLSAPIEARIKVSPSGIRPKEGTAHKVSLSDSVDITETASGG